MTKYHSKKTVIDGIGFDSKLEANCYLFLKPLFPSLELQPKYLLQPKFRVNNEAIREINYNADFKFKIKDIEIIIDSKGMETDVFKIKRKMLLYKYPGINFYTVKSLKALKILIDNLIKNLV